MGGSTTAAQVGSHLVNFALAPESLSLVSRIAMGMCAACWLLCACACFHVWVLPGRLSIHPYPRAVSAALRFQYHVLEVDSTYLWPRSFSFPSRLLQSAGSIPLRHLQTHSPPPPPSTL